MYFVHDYLSRAFSLSVIRFSLSFITLNIELFNYYLIWLGRYTYSYDSMADTSAGLNDEVFIIELQFIIIAFKATNLLGLVVDSL